jgi:hypothetical protein
MLDYQIWDGCGCLVMVWEEEAWDENDELCYIHWAITTA